MHRKCRSRSLTKHDGHPTGGRAFDQFSVSRRSVLKGIGGAAAVGVGSGFLSRRALSAGTLNYMCWEGYDSPELIKPFEEEHDVTVAFDLIIDSPGAFAKIAAGGHRDFDLASLDSPWIVRMGPAGVCEFLDPDDFKEEFDSFYPEFQHPFSPLTYDGKITGLPTRWGWVAAPINLDYSTVEEWRSYDPCFDPKNRDRIGLMDWGDWPIMPMVLHAGINPYRELDQAELNEVRKVFRALFKNTRALFADLTLARKALLDGSVKTLIGTGTYATNAIRRDGYKQVLSVVPEPRDGLNQGVLWIEGTAIIREPSEPELAKKLIKHMATPEGAYHLSWPAGGQPSNPTPVKAAEALYSDEQKDAMQMDYMWEAFAKCEIHDVAPNIDEMLVIWQEELASAG